jgi:hypothetical protein
MPGCFRRSGCGFRDGSEESDAAANQLANFNVLLSLLSVYHTRQALGDILRQLWTALRQENPYRSMACAKRACCPWNQSRLGVGTKCAAKTTAYYVQLRLGDSGRGRPFAPGITPTSNPLSRRWPVLPASGSGPPPIISMAAPPTTGAPLSFAPAAAAGQPFAPGITLTRNALSAVAGPALHPAGHLPSSRLAAPRYLGAPPFRLRQRYCSGHPAFQLRARPFPHDRQSAPRRPATAPLGRSHRPRRPCVQRGVGAPHVVRRHHAPDLWHGP